MNTYASIGLSAALMALSGAAGYQSAIYLRPLQPSQQQQAVATPAPIPVIRTVSWFKAHDAERNAKLVACADNPGVARMGDPECTNARVARDDISFDKFINDAR